MDNIEKRKKKKKKLTPRPGRSRISLHLAAHCRNRRLKNSRLRTARACDQSAGEVGIGGNGGSETRRIVSWTEPSEGSAMVDNRVEVLRLLRRFGGVGKRCAAGRADVEAERKCNEMDDDVKRVAEGDDEGDCDGGAGNEADDGCLNSAIVGEGVRWPVVGDVDDGDGAGDGRNMRGINPISAMMMFIGCCLRLMK